MSHYLCGSRAISFDRSVHSKFEKEFKDLKATVEDLCDQGSSEDGSDDGDCSCSCCKSQEDSLEKA